MEKQTFEKLLLTLNRIGNIILSLEKWHTQYREFSGIRLRSLVQITFFVPDAEHHAVNLGFCTTLETSRTHKNIHGMQETAIGLFRHLTHSVSDGLKKDMATEECYDLVRDTMTQSCCNYLFHMTSIGEPRKLQQKMLTLC